MMKHKFARTALVAALAAVGAPAAMAESIAPHVEVTMKAMDVSNDGSTGRAIKAAENLCRGNAGVISGVFNVEQKEVYGIYYTGVDLSCRIPTYQ